MSLVEFIFRKAGKNFNFTKDRLHLLVPLGIWKNLHSIYFLYPCRKLLVYYVMTRSFLLDTRVFSLYLFQWRHWEITSECYFFRIIYYFQFFVQTQLHFFEMGLYDLQLPFTLQDIVGEVSYLPTSSIQQIIQYRSCSFPH